MPELIDRQAAIKAICGDCRSGYGGHCPHPLSVCYEIECLRKQPTIEPEGGAGGGLKSQSTEMKMERS